MELDCHNRKYEMKWTPFFLKVHVLQLFIYINEFNLSISVLFISLAYAVFKLFSFCLFLVHYSLLFYSLEEVKIFVKRYFWIF